MLGFVGRGSDCSYAQQTFPSSSSPFPLTIFVPYRPDVSLSKARKLAFALSVLPRTPRPSVSSRWFNRNIAHKDGLFVLRRGFEDGVERTPRPSGS